MTDFSAVSTRQSRRPNQKVGRIRFDRAAARNFNIAHRFVCFVSAVQSGAGEPFFCIHNRRTGAYTEILDGYIEIKSQVSKALARRFFITASKLALKYNESFS
jgi:hypothetical protein